MLPEGFAWQAGTGRNLSLKLHGKTVALLVALELGYGFRLEINPDSCSRRTVFMHSKEQSTQYLEAWATKWEARLKGVSGAAQPVGEKSVSG